MVQIENYFIHLRHHFDSTGKMETLKTRGRKRKSDDHRKKGRQIYATDSEWLRIGSLADTAGSEVSPFIIQKILS